MGREATLPNIVLIQTDDQRWDTLDATHGIGAPVMPTTLLELAASGVLFSRATVTTSVCTPSRCSLLTGKYAHTHGVLRNTPPDGGAAAFDDSITLATLLQAAGYRTALVGKYMNGYSVLSPYIPPGWDDWRAFVDDPQYFDYALNENGVIVPYGSAASDYATDVLLGKSLDFIAASVASGAPFLLCLSTNAPHAPFVPAPRHVGTLAALPRWKPPSLNEPDVSDKAPWLQAQPQLTGTQLVQVQEKRIGYLETLLAVDEAVGAIMQELRDDAIDGNTLVVFMGDNGYLWGEHRLRAKESPYDEAMRVPMIVRYPPLVTSPRVDPSLVANIDLLPTILDLAGVPIPGGVNGASLVPLLSGPGTWRSEILNEHWLAAGVHVNPVPENALVLTDQYKYVEYTDTGEGTELYDLATDPYELVNRTNDPLLAVVKVDLAARLQALKAQ